MRPLVPSPGGIPLAYARTPFAKDVHRDVLPFGLTVTEMLREVPDLPDRFWTEGVVCANFVYCGKAYSEPVPRPMWPFLRLEEKPVRVTVTMHLPLGFGGGGGGQGGGGHKSTFALIASIALLAATTAISAGALGPAGVGLFATGFLATSQGAAVLAAGVGIIGGLAIAALSPPPSLQRSANNSDDRTLGSASASGNQLEPGGVIPRVVGTFRASPSFACPPLVDIDGDDQIVEAIFAMSGPHKWDQIRIDKIPIESDEAFQHETREGFDSDLPLTLVTRQGFTETPNLELSEHVIKLDDTDVKQQLKDQAVPANSVPKFHTIISRRSPDEIWITVLFPEGMIFADDDGSMLVPVRLRMRQRGGVPTWINFPEIHFRFRGSTPFRKMIKLKWIDAPADPLPTPEVGFAPTAAYKLVPTQTVDPIGSGGWTADSYFSAGAGNDVYDADHADGVTNVRNVALFDDRVEFYLGTGASSGASFPRVPPDDEGFDIADDFGVVWEIQATRGMPIAPSFFNSETYVYVDDVIDFFGWHMEDGNAVVADSAVNAHSKIVIQSIASVWNEYPIAGPGLALLAIKAKNKAVQNVSALLSGYVPDWNGSSWSGWNVTSNPAPHYRYILTGDVNADPLPPALVDDTSLVEWRTRCATDRLTCDMIADGRNAQELLQVLAGCGFARPRQSEVWGVVQDRDRSGEAVVQMFTPINSRDFRFNKAFPVLPHGLRVRYADASRDYEEAPELIVYADGYNADGSGGKLQAQRLEQVTYDGVTTGLNAANRAAFDLAQARLRSTFYSASVDAEALVSTNGDLVGVQHDILARQAGFARVKEKVTDGSFVTGLVLNSKIPTALGADFFSIPDLFTCPDIFALEGTTGIAIRLKDGSGTVIAQELSDPLGYVDEITFTTPIADPGDDLLGPDCLVASGELGSEYLRAILTGVEPGPDLTASLSFLDEAPALWSIELADNSFDSSFDNSFG